MLYWYEKRTFSKTAFRGGWQPQGDTVINGVAGHIKGQPAKSVLSNTVHRRASETDLMPFYPHAGPPVLHPSSPFHSSPHETLTNICLVPQ